MEASETPTGPIRVGLIGRGISRSLSPMLHMSEGRALGLDYVYELIDTSAGETRDLPQILLEAQEAGWAGLNITHPYKIEIIHHLDHLSDTARRLGAVNTVVFKDGLRVGHNTDYSGFVTSFKQELGSASKERVLLLGAGGAGAGVAFGLLDCGVDELTIHDLDPDRAGNLAARLQTSYPDKALKVLEYLAGVTLQEIDGVVNATPMGMAAHPGMVLPAGSLSPVLWVADIVYFPLETELLRHARAFGCAVLNGSGMAVYQAAHAFRLFTGRTADGSRMKREFARLTRAEKEA